MPKRNLEDDLTRAVQIPVPRGLNGRILAHQARHERRRLLWAFTLMASMAATALWLYVRSGMGPLNPHLTLGQAVIEHIQAEPQALRDRDALDKRAVDQVLGAIGLRVGASLGAVTYAERCMFRARAIGHLVLDVEPEPLTLLFLPHETVDGPQTFEGGGFRGVLVAAGTGSLALVGRSRNDLLPVARELLATAGW